MFSRSRAASPGSVAGSIRGIVTRFPWCHAQRMSGQVSISVGSDRKAISVRASATSGTPARFSATAALASRRRPGVSRATASATSRRVCRFAAVTLSGSAAIAPNVPDLRPGVQRRP